VAAGVAGSTAAPKLLGQAPRCGLPRRGTLPRHRDRLAVATVDTRLDPCARGRGLATLGLTTALDSPTGERMIIKPYPKDDEPRTLRVSQDLLDTLADRIASLGLGREDLLFPSREVASGAPLSRATFNTRYWRPAVARSGIDFPVRMHDLRHAHASWLLAGGTDLKSVMERMGHAQIQTTQKYLHTPTPRS